MWLRMWSLELGSLGSCSPSLPTSCINGRSALASLTFSSVLLTGARDMVPNSEGLDTMKAGQYVDIHNSTFSVLALLLLLCDGRCHLSLIL